MIVLASTTTKVAYDVELDVSLLFEPRDVWVGLFVDKPTSSGRFKFRRLYVTVLPMLPVRVRLRTPW